MCSVHPASFHSVKFLTNLENVSDEKKKKKNKKKKTTETPKDQFHPKVQTISFLVIHYQLKTSAVALRWIDRVPPQTHRRSQPANSGGLGGSRAQFVESQRGRSGREVGVLKQPAALHTLGLQPLKILTQELDGVVVLAQSSIPVPLAPQPVGHASGVDPLPHWHSEIRPTVVGWLGVCVCVCAPLQCDVKTFE